MWREHLTSKHLDMLQLGRKMFSVRGGGGKDAFCGLQSWPKGKAGKIHVEARYH